MSDGVVTVLDGSKLRGIDLSLPFSDVTVTGDQVLELANSRASSSLLGIDLPESLRAFSLNRIGINDVVSFRGTEITPDQASLKLKDYISAIADELADDPLVVSILDGNTIQLYLEDEDDFAMVAENLFTELDTEDKGKIGRSEIQNALAQLGVDMGVPPISEYPQLKDILTKHGVEGEDELGQAQFAQLLQPILQELADALAERHFVFIHTSKINNGSKLRKLLADEQLLDNIIEEIWQENKNRKDGTTNLKTIRNSLEKKGMELGLPQPDANEAVFLLYDTVFAEVVNENSVVKEKHQFGERVKEILKTFAKHLQEHPIYHEVDSSEEV